MKNALLSVILAFVFTLSGTALSKEIKDSSGRIVKLPDNIGAIICSGSGCLRLITYFQAQKLVVAVDNIEKRKTKFDARPYAIANPHFKKLPVFGGFRGNDYPEKIISLRRKPDLIFKTYPGSGYDPLLLEKRTGIPVVTLKYGDLLHKREVLFKSLDIIGKALGREKRAKELTDFFSKEIKELKKRTANVSKKRSCFVGGIAFKGPHGFQSTEPNYPPFHFINGKNVAYSKKLQNLRHSNFSKEELLRTDPDYMFLDLSTLKMDRGGLHELKYDSVYRALSAVRSKRVYGVLPYNWYTQNFGSILADAWFIGKTIYPDFFSDIDPVKKADSIYGFLLGKPVYKTMDNRFLNMSFKVVNTGGK